MAWDAYKYSGKHELERAVIEALGLNDRVISLDLHFAYDEIPKAHVTMLIPNKDGKLSQVFRDFAFYAIPKEPTFEEKAQEALEATRKINSKQAGP